MALLGPHAGNGWAAGHVHLCDPQSGLLSTAKKNKNNTGVWVKASKQAYFGFGDPNRSKGHPDSMQTEAKRFGSTGLSLSPIQNLPRATSPGPFSHRPSKTGFLFFFWFQLFSALFQRHKQAFKHGAGTVGKTRGLTHPNPPRWFPHPNESYLGKNGTYDHKPLKAFLRFAGGHLGSIKTCQKEGYRRFQVPCKEPSKYAFDTARSLLKGLCLTPHIMLT